MYLSSIDAIGGWKSCLEHEGSSWIAVASI